MPLNPQMLQSLLSGSLAKDGSGPGSLGALGGGLQGAMGGLVPMMLVLAGMGATQLPRLLNSMMDFQQTGQGDQEEQPGALPTPADQGAAPGPAPMGPTGAPPPPNMGAAPAGAPPAGGPPPGLAQMLMMMAMRNRMAGGPPSA